jgi:hypothetical protein
VGVRDGAAGGTWPVPLPRSRAAGAAWGAALVLACPLLLANWVCRTWEDKAAGQPLKSVDWLQALDSSHFVLQQCGKGLRQWLPTSPSCSS